MNIIIKKDINEDIINFLIDESFKLFIQLYEIDTTNQLVLKRMKESLIEFYTSDIDTSTFYSAYIDNKIVGAGVIHTNNDFSDLFVKEEYQNKGIGTYLIETIIKDNEKKGTIYINGNKKYLNFFEKHGFIEYENNDKAVKMYRKVTNN